MRLDELINENYNKLNESDLQIWQYIQGNKKECCSISIEELAGRCCVSRTTVSRFARKLSFEGFRELKMHLKLEYEGDKVMKDVVLDDICQSYIKCIQNARDTDMEEICRHIFKADRLFVFGTGEAQNAAAQTLRRMFMYTKRFFVVLAGKSELTAVLEDLGKNDFVIIISFSGENEMAVKAAKKIRGKGGYLLSLTELGDNTLARLSDRSLYITANPLMRVGEATFETCSSFHNVLEILCVKYLLYLERTESDRESVCAVRTENVQGN